MNDQQLKSFQDNFFIFFGRVGKFDELLVYKILFQVDLQKRLLEKNGNFQLEEDPRLLGIFIEQVAKMFIQENNYQICDVCYFYKQKIEKCEKCETCYCSIFCHLLKFECTMTIPK